MEPEHAFFPFRHDERIVRVRGRPRAALVDEGAAAYGARVLTAFARPCAVERDKLETPRQFRLDARKFFDMYFLFRAVHDLCGHGDRVGVLKHGIIQIERDFRRIDVFQFERLALAVRRRQIFKNGFFGKDLTFGIDEIRGKAAVRIDEQNALLVKIPLPVFGKKTAGRRSQRLAPVGGNQFFPVIEDLRRIRFEYERRGGRFQTIYSALFLDHNCLRFT